MKKGFRILKFKKDKPIFEVQNVSKSFDGRPVLKKLSLKVYPGKSLESLDQMDVVRRLYFRCVSVNKM